MLERQTQSACPSRGQKDHAPCQNDVQFYSAAGFEYASWSHTERKVDAQSCRLSRRVQESPSSTGSDSTQASSGTSRSLDASSDGTQDSPPVDIDSEHQQQTSSVPIFDARPERGTVDDFLNPRPNNQVPLGQRQHPRRIPHPNTHSVPATLQRQQDRSQCFVANLILVAMSLVAAIWPTSKEPPKMSSAFNGAGVLPLQTFIQETLKRSKTSYSTLQVALYYLIMLKCVKPSGDFTQEQPKPAPGTPCTFKSKPCRAMQCGRRMFLSALMLAQKYLQDKHYSTRAWSKISGLRSQEINENEMDYLGAIKYEVHVKKETFDNWSRIVLALCNPPEKLGPGMFTPRMYSWNKLILRLQPDVIQSPQKTQELLDDIAAGVFLDMDSSSRSCSDQRSGKPSPSPSPCHETLPIRCREDGVPAMTHTHPFTHIPRSAPAGPSGPSQVRMHSGVPATPSLAKLPTPSSTPSLSGFSWSNSSMPYLVPDHEPRCGPCPKANLATCPPPQPRCAGWSRPTMERCTSPKTVSVISTPSLMTSPGSIFSDNLSFASRSRSTSISSASSSEYNTICNLRRECKTTRLPSPLRRVLVGSSEVLHGLTETVLSSTQPCAPLEKCGSRSMTVDSLLLDHVRESMDEDYSPGSSMRAAQTLVMLSTISRDIDGVTVPQKRASPPSPAMIDNPTLTRKEKCKTQKRGLCHKTKKLQERTRHFLRDEKASEMRIVPIVDVVDDPMSTADCTDEKSQVFSQQCPTLARILHVSHNDRKETQEPTAPWAKSKEPIPVRGCATNKRVAKESARQCYPSSCTPESSSASFVAADILRHEILA